MTINYLSKLMIILVVVCPVNILAQDGKISIHNSSTLGPASRYEIVQSSLAAKWTFRLDKVCGNVSQLVSTTKDAMTWESMGIVSAVKCNNDGKNRFQIFTSGLAARHTFLMNTENGKTWILTSYTNKEGNEFNGWSIFEE